MESAAPGLRAAVGATLLVADADAALVAYRDSLGLRVVEASALGAQEAAAWGAPSLAGARAFVLAGAVGEGWLRIVEAGAHATAAPAFARAGWMALEICVRDVDALAARLRGGPFREICPPANLDLSDDIRAFQVEGVAGEVLYLTEIKGPVAPFRLPSARCEVDRLFIPVLACAQRDAATGFYEALSVDKVYRFQTRISCVNVSRGRDFEHKYDVACLQLYGESLIEIDELPQLDSLSDDGLPAGIFSVSFSVPALPAGAAAYTLAGGPFKGRRATLCRGVAGERVELVECGEIG